MEILRNYSKEKKYFLLGHELIMFRYNILIISTRYYSPLLCIFVMVLGNT
jgi:hypothetical protein